MYGAVTSAAIVGVEARLVSVEADISRGMPSFSMVGYLAGEVREAQERIRAAIHTIGVTLPVGRVTVNLSPADVRKEGAAFDLPIAVALLTAAGVLPIQGIAGTLIVGELSLSGQIRPVRGVIQFALAARSFGCEKMIVPMQNLTEASVIQGLAVYGADSLTEVTAYIKGEASLKTERADIGSIRARQEEKGYPDFADIKGQYQLRRCAEIAAAGFHNLLIIGTPGAGKSMTAKRIPSILPRPDEDEMLEITKVYSAAGLLPKEGIVTIRPFRSPHHTASVSSLAGGGRSPRPGEISLSHRGVLFLDELPEFSSAALEILRQPMEDGEITITRVSGSCTFPAQFMLVGALNPCKCGYWPDRTRCRCTQSEVRKYLQRISQPLIDRMDLCISVGEPSFEELTGEGGESSDEMRLRVERAVERQKERFRAGALRFNSELTLQEAEKYCHLGRKEKSLLEEIYAVKHLTGRSALKLLRVARTIADLDASETVLCHHLQEAAQYRTPDREYWGDWD